LRLSSTPSLQEEAEQHEREEERLEDERAGVAEREDLVADVAVEHRDVSAAGRYLDHMVYADEQVNRRVVQVKVDIDEARRLIVDEPQRSDSAQLCKRNVLCFIE
jgi:hypothetical protein